MHLIMRVNKSFDLSKVHDAKKIKRPKYLSLFRGVYGRALYSVVMTLNLVDLSLLALRK